MLEADDALATSQETRPGDEDEEVQVLVDAVTECDLDKLDGCLQRFSSEPTQLEAVVNEYFDADGTTLLWLACQLGHEHIVERLIAAGADVNGVACGESTRKSCAKSSCLPRFGLHICLSASQLLVPAPDEWLLASYARGSAARGQRIRPREVCGSTPGCQCVSRCC